MFIVMKFYLIFRIVRVKMKKLIFVSIILLCLACTPSYENQTSSSEWILPPELRDCKMFKLSSSDGVHMRVLRCPSSNTTTSTQCGKSTCYTGVYE